MWFVIIVGLKDVLVHLYFLYNLICMLCFWLRCVEVDMV